MERTDTVVTNLSEHLNSALKLLADYREIQQVSSNNNHKDEPAEHVDQEEPLVKQTEIDRLRLENHRLRARCELLESGNSADVTRRIDDAVDQSHQLDVLSHKITEFKCREEKIIETLGKKAVELRTAFFILTGYQVYACKDIVYKIKSLYAKGKEDKLVFQLSPQGKIKLIETPYSQRFSRYISTYLSDGADHFPAFLASVTLELFNATTSRLPTNLNASRNNTTIRSNSTIRSNTTTSVDMELTLKPG